MRHALLLAALLAAPAAADRRSWTALKDFLSEAFGSR